MKYKKQIATGALAISLLVGGSNVFASTPQDLGIKNTQSIYQKQNKNPKIKNAGKSKLVGTVGAINGSGFTLELKNLKAKTTSSVEVQTSGATTFSQNGIKIASSALALGQKVIVSGVLDKTTNILIAKTVKIAK